MEGVREVAHDGTFLGIEGADGRTTLSVANLNSARQPRMGQDAGRARGAEGRGARLDRIPQRALHRDRGPEPARRHRRKRTAIPGIACARWPAAQQRAAKWGERERSAQKKTPGAQGAGRRSIGRLPPSRQAALVWASPPSASAARRRPLALLESTSVMRCTAPRSSSFSTAAISRAMRSSASS